MERKYLFSSESVFEGHPDKVADQISDAILDAHLSIDPKARVACNTLVAKDLVVIAGEITSQAKVSYENVVRQKLKEIGYIDQSCGMDSSTCKILTSVSQQSPAIANGIDHEDGELGAGDQGMMFGYACDETVELMPLGIVLAHRIAQKQSELRKNGQLPWLKPDGKTQVTVRYEKDKPVLVEKVIFSTHHSQGMTEDEIHNMKYTVVNMIMNDVIPCELRNANTVYLINPAGRFDIGGPQADTGLTGRKIVVDTYGGYCPHGGGAFSGKDPTKVDRSAAYMARYIAKNIVKAGLASRCTVQLSYAIGKADPIALMLDLHNTGKVAESGLEDAVRQIFPLTPKGIIDALNLRRPIYQKTAAFGHFGRELSEFTWEKTDRVLDLNNYFNIKGAG
jgi:S-adenosylmethionine synthetase